MFYVAVEPIPRLGVPVLNKNLEKILKILESSRSDTYTDKTDYDEINSFKLAF